MEITGFKTSFSRTRPQGNNANENKNWKPQTRQTFKALHDLAQFQNL